MPQNQHYISKCLTKPWESHGKLYYFDFETQKIESDSSRKLFAKMDLWSSKLEEVFHRRFEKQLKNEIVNFMKGTPVDPEAIPYRHILLMHIFDAMRGMKVYYNISTIERFALLTNNQLDEEIAEVLRTDLIVRIPIDPVYRLFFSENGFFSVPLTLKCSNEMTVGFAIPLSTNMAFGLFPLDYNRADFLKKANESETYFLNLSVGNSGRRLVIHPDLVQDEPYLIDKILLARKENQRSAALMLHSSEALQNRIAKALHYIKHHETTNT